MQVEFDSTPEHFSFLFKAPALRADEIRLGASDTVISLQIPKVKVKRGWLKTPDPEIKRSYIRPSLHRRGGALLRIRLHRPVPSWMRNSARWENQAGGLRLSFPRNQEVAQRWEQGHGAQEPKISDPPKPIMVAPLSIKLEPASPLDAAPPDAASLPDAVSPSADTAPLPDANSLFSDLPSLDAELELRPLSQIAAVKKEEQSTSLLPALLLGFLGLLLLLSASYFILRRPSQGLIPPLRLKGSLDLGEGQRLLLVEAEESLVLLASTSGKLELLTQIAPLQSREDPKLNLRAQTALEHIRSQVEVPGAESSDPEDVKLLAALLNDEDEGE